MFRITSRGGCETVSGPLDPRPLCGIGDAPSTVDRLIDMCRTAANVTGDATVAAVVAASENQLFPTANNGMEPVDLPGGGPPPGMSPQTP